MKYLIIFVTMSVAGTFGVVSSVSDNTNRSIMDIPTGIPVEYIEFNTPIYITPSF